MDCSGSSRGSGSLYWSGSSPVLLSGLAIRVRFELFKRQAGTARGNRRWTARAARAVPAACTGRGVRRCCCPDWRSACALSCLRDRPEPREAIGDGLLGQLARFRQLVLVGEFAGVAVRIGDPLALALLDAVEAFLLAGRDQLAID